MPPYQARSTAELPPLIITATPNKCWLEPELPYPETIPELVEECVASEAAGASILHLHAHTEWPVMIPAVRARTTALVQCGMSSFLVDDRLDIFTHHGDMVSVIANHHDEAFPEGATNVLHPMEELVRYCELGIEYSVRPEWEVWHSGSVWNLEQLIERTTLVEPVITTLFFGWPGGTWSPPTIEEYLVRRRMMPASCAVTVSVMGPERFGILSAAITSGDNVRVGTEDYARNRRGEPAQASELVAEVAALSEALGRRVATPAEARRLLNFS
jgi:3-keto-5-aminohexanoate cleavage enzyme